MPNKLEDFQNIQKHYPELSVITNPNTGAYRITGNLAFKAVVDKQQAVIDQYKVEIDIPANFPRSLPTVKEINGRIPKKDENHVNENDTLCLGLPIKVRELFNKNGSLLGFIDNIVVPFFCGYLYKEQTGKWIEGESDHGDVAVYKDYKHRFNTSSDKVLIKLLEDLSRGIKPKGYEKCICGGNKLRKNCKYYCRLLRKLRKTKHDFKKDLRYVKRYLKMEND